MAKRQATPPTFRQQHLHEYNCWKAMRSRCQSPANASWRLYGARGVAVCERWQSFEAFLADVGAAPTPRHQLDRIDNDKGYDPSNVFWSTPAEQQANTSKVVYLTCRGVTLSAKDWSALFDVPAATILARVSHLGWSEEDAILTPVNEQFRPKAIRPGPREGSRRWEREQRKKKGAPA